MVFVASVEDAVLESMVPAMEADGFIAFVHPSKTMLPDFFGTYRPDAIAYKGDRKIAIEVMGQALGDETELETIRRIFAEHPEWELRVLYAPRVFEDLVPAASKAVIEAHLRRIETSLDEMGAAAAFLLAWAAFEAAARRLTTVAAVPQSTGRVLDSLAHDGYVTPDEADELRSLQRARNELAHGGLEVTIAKPHIAKIIMLTRTILALQD
jgi:uncharacterized protein YutE (UPF0331/DUF86 family)